MKETEKGVTDFSLEKGYYPNFDTFKVGGHEFTLKDCKEVYGHDDSLPYVANLYIDGKKVCSLFNDGWGGETTIPQVFNEKLFDKATEDIKGQPLPTFPWMKDEVYEKFTLKSIVEIADILAYDLVEINKVFKKCNKETSIIAFNGVTTRYFVIPNKTKANQLTDGSIKASIKKCDELRMEGYYILNAPQMYYNKK